MSKKKTHEEYIDEVKNINPNIEVIGIYNGAGKRIEHKCLIHNIIWNTSPTSILMGCGCKECAKEKHYAKTAKTHNQYIEELKSIHDNIEVLEDYKDALTKILHRCNIHNYEWYVAPANILSRKGCPKCSGKYRKTHNDYIIELKEKNPTVIALEQYKDAKTPIKHKCLTHNHEWNIAPTSALNGNGCPKCHKEKISVAKLKTHEEYLKELYDVHPNIVPLEEYKGALTPIKHQCKLDNHIWITSPSCILNHNCPKCSNKAVPTQDEYINRLKAINPNLLVISDYTNMKNNIRVKCNIDGFEWDAKAEVLLRGTRCPCCNSKSLGEINIKNYLDNHNIQYDYQKKFDECRNTRPLPFDFYIPIINTCIEYDGIQHFEPIDFAGRGQEWAIEHFKSTQERDKIKTEYCKNNGIKLIRIPYYKDIESELNLLFA